MHGMKWFLNRIQWERVEIIVRSEILRKEDPLLFKVILTVAWALWVFQSLMSLSEEIQKTKVEKIYINVNHGEAFSSWNTHIGYTDIKT